MSILRRISLVLIIIFAIAAAQAQWTEVVPGIDYQEFNISGPNNVFVARLDRTNESCIIDSCLGQGELISGRETVSGMANRYDGAINYWGQSWGSTNDVIVAINGDFWDTVNLKPVSGQILSGWYARRFTDFSGGSGFSWQLDRDAFIGGCVRHISSRNYVTYTETGQTQNINDINVERGSDELILYTSQYNENTSTDNSGVEVLLEMARPSMILPQPADATGTIVEVRNSQGSTPIPFRHVVLSATGSAATKLAANSTVGQTIEISQEITHYEKDCSTSNPWDWTKSYGSIGGGFVFLKDGTAQSTTNTDRHPRTAVALNNDYVFFMVVDGRDTGVSIGMTYAEMADFCKNTLGATDGINQDGGGSSAIWVNGEIKNKPSDGSERATYNGLMMISVQTQEQTTTFSDGASVRTTAAGSLRLGPGNNYGILQSISSGETGTVVNDSLNGVLAKGSNWWKCDFAGVVGWMDEAVLEDVTTRIGEWSSFKSSK